MSSSVAARRFSVPAECEGLRLDQCLARQLPELSRRTAKVALDIGCVFVNRKRTKTASRKMRAGDEIVVHLGKVFERAVLGANEQHAEPQYDVLFEDEHLVVVFKPAGLITAPTPESDRNTLQHALERRAPRRQSVYVVHRLDMQTSGLLVFAKSSLMNRALSEMFRQHDLVRRYDAFVEGRFLPDALRVDAPVGGKSAVTHLRVEQRYADCTWLEATLETGRTHQIRRHVQQLGHPVLADPQYGRPHPAAPSRLALHAKHLGFQHPVTRQTLEFSQPLPADLAHWVAQRG